MRKIHQDKKRKKYVSPDAFVVVFPGMSVLSGDGTAQWTEGINTTSGDYNTGVPADSNDDESEWASDAGARDFGIFED